MNEDDGQEADNKITATYNRTTGLSQPHQGGAKLFRFLRFVWVLGGYVGRCLPSGVVESDKADIYLFI